MGRVPSSKSSSSSSGYFPLPLSEASSGSPQLGSFLPSDASSGSPSLAHFLRFQVGSFRHRGSASSRSGQPFPCPPSQRCGPDGDHSRSTKRLPLKPLLGSVRTARTPFSSSRMEEAKMKAAASPTHDDDDRKMGYSSNEDSSLPAEKLSNSSLKIVIRWGGNKPGAADEEDCRGEAPKEAVEKVEEEELENQVEKKNWNLRPRKPVGRGGAGGGKEPQLQEGSSSQKAAPKKKPAAKKPKPLKLSIALTRREIDEDLYAMTGSRPSRKPRRRTKQLQNIVNHLSPAIGLQSITPSSYNARG